MKAFASLLQNTLNYSLVPISFRELMFIDHAPCTLYILHENKFTLIFSKNSKINKAQLKQLILKGHVKFFVHEEERKFLILDHQKNLTSISRSLSIGSPTKNAKKMLNLLTINLEYCYLDPTNDEILKIQFQNLLNLASFLYNNPQEHNAIFNDYMTRKHHFIYAQPIISSLFVIGILKQAHIFSQKESELLFIASCLKDLGMSIIPQEKYDKKQLSNEDKRLFLSHPGESIRILEGKVPLSSRYLNIIENHHAFSFLNPKNSSNQSKAIMEISGAETIIIICMDVIAAMITNRPYRKPQKLFEALSFIKPLISDEYPMEFKIIVNYFKNFFKQ